MVDYKTALDEGMTTEEFAWENAIDEVIHVLGAADAPLTYEEVSDQLGYSPRERFGANPLADLVAENQASVNGSREYSLN